MHKNAYSWLPSPSPHPHVGHVGVSVVEGKVWGWLWTFCEYLKTHPMSVIGLLIKYKLQEDYLKLS